MSGLINYLKSPWLDLLLPLSLMGFIWERSGNPVVMVCFLATWCALKFARWLPSQPVYGVLIGAISIILSAVIHPLSASAPTDLLLVLLAFAAGLQQSKDQWRISMWIVLATVIVSLPFLELSRFNGNVDVIPWSSLRDALPKEAIRIQKLTINRSAYLYGLFSLVGYGLWRLEKWPWRSAVAGVIGGLSYLLACATGSRAALIFPFAIVVVTELCWRHRHWVAKQARFLATAVLLLSLLFNFTLYWPSGPIAANDQSDVGRAEIAQCFLEQSLKSLPDLVIGQGYDRVSDHCAQRVFLPGRTKGIPHAHNVFVQALADQGLLTLMLMVMAFAVILHRLFLGLGGDAAHLCLTGLSCALFILASALVESTLLKTSLQQVISGYLLAVAWVAPPSGGPMQQN